MARSMTRLLSLGAYRLEVAHTSVNQCWGNLVTCNLSYVIFITFEANSNITKLHFSQVICNCNNITLRGDTMYITLSIIALHKSSISLIKTVLWIHVHG